jgi:hypothetical protein
MASNSWDLGYTLFLLTKIDGWHALRKVDLAAHDRLTKSISFKEEKVSNMARTLATRLAVALTPLFSTSTDTVFQDVDHGLENNGIWEDWMIWFTDIFKIVLNFKAATTTTPHQYQFITYTPGTPYVATESTKSSAELDKSVVGHSDNEPPKLLLASLRSYRRQPSIPHQRVYDAVVEPNNFSTGTRLDPCIHEKLLLLPEPTQVEHQLESTSQRQTETHPKDSPTIDLVGDPTISHEGLQTGWEPQIASDFDKKAKGHSSLLATGSSNSKSKNSNGATPHGCSKCGKQFQSRWALSRHKNNNKSPPSP